MTDPAPDEGNSLRMVDGLVALVLAGFAAVYLFFWMMLVVSRATFSELITDANFIFPPILMAFSAFYGLYETSRLSRNPSARAGLIAPISLFGTAAVFVWVWAVGARSDPSGFGLVLLPGVLAAWSGGRLMARWLQQRRVT